MNDQQGWSAPISVSWLLTLVCWSVCCLPVRADGSLPVNSGTVGHGEFRGVDLEGNLHRLGDHGQSRAVVCVFLSTQCPVSNAAIPTIQQLASRYLQQGIEFYGVASNPGLTRQAAIAHRDSYKISFPILFDTSGHLRGMMQATHTPQAIVASPSGTILYSGRIDNRYSSIGRARSSASIHDLQNALQDIVANRPVRVASTRPVGCQLEDPPVDGARGPVTYNRHIAPILSAHCAECHRDGQAAPFTLLSYADACRHSRQIVEVTQSQFMPPWHPVEHFGQFQNERRLSAEDIALIQAWVDAGRPEGDAANELTLPKFQDGWRLGRPDLILTMPDTFRVAAGGPDIHQHFVLRTGLNRHRLVAAIEFRPGNPRVVHHACFYTDVTGAARRLQARHPDVGYGSFSGPGFVNANTLRSWLPGMSPQRLPDWSGQLMHAKCDLVLEIHYQRTGKVESDRSTVGIHFAPKSAKRLVNEIQVMNKSLTIPAGDSRYHHHASYTLPADAILFDAAPHLHLLGREMKAVATRPDGEVVPLIWIQDWDFNWQGQYLYLQPLKLPKGTRIDVDAWYDNSAGNPLNPNSPPQDVHWGEQTSDEMGICHFRYTCDSMEDFVLMHEHYLNYVARQQPASRRNR